MARQKGAATSPFSYFEWMVARRYLGATRSGKGVSLISIIAFVGIMLAVAALISVMSIMQGFRLTLLDQLLGTTGHAHVQAEFSITDYEDLSRALSDTPGVIGSTPLIEMPVFASGPGESGMVVRGIRREDLLRNEYIVGDNHVVDGSFENFGVGSKGGNEIAIGSRIASQLGVRAGDPVTLISGQGPETAFGRTLRRKTYIVGAVFHAGNAEYDAIYGFMPLEQAQLFLALARPYRKLK